MPNQQKKYRTRSRKKPIFSDKKSGNSAVGIIIMIVLLAAMVFIGYSVGKPIVEYFSGRPANTEPDGDAQPIEPVTPPQTDKPDPEPTASEQVSAVSDDTQTTPDPEPIEPKNILYIAYPGAEGASYDSLIASKIAYALDNNYSGICIELVANGGAVAYNTQSELAALAEAIPSNGIANLSATVEDIKAAGLIAYARVSALSDHLASWYDKGVAYMIQGSTSRWLDNALSSGGKPWLSPFEQRSKDYIAGFAKEISEAGFEGIILGELEFPELRRKDLEYIGDSVKSQTRYKALNDFAQYIINAYGAGKQAIIEVDAADVISGKAEILKSGGELCTKNIYIRFNPTELGTRVTRPDGSVVSFEGLSPAYTLKAVMQTVNDRLSGLELTVIPIISGCEIDEGMEKIIAELNLGDNVIIEE